MSIFQNNPYNATNITTIKDALDGMKAFNAIYAVQQCDNNDEVCGNKDDTAAWRKLVYDGVINCGGEPMELDFFEKIFGGKTEFIDAKNLYFRYRADIDMNIYAQESVTAAAAGDPATFRVLKSLHAGGGKYSYPVEGYSIYIYEDRQWVYVSAKNTDNDYGHTVTVKPFNSNYKINIRKNKKMMVLPVMIVGGLSSPKVGSTIETPGYTRHIKPFRVRKDWELAIDLMRGYEEVLQWAIMFDANGNEVDCWEAYVKTQARRDMKWAKNLLFFMGQQVTNTQLATAIGGTGPVTADYGGFDGYIPTMHYGGGQVSDFDPGIGYDLEADFEPTILRNDASKQTNEYLVLHGKPFKMGLNRNANQKFKNNAGACTFQTFQRSGMNQDDIRKLGVSSYEYEGYSLHFKEVSALSDSRGIGNFDFPYQANFIPGNGLRDSKGRNLPAIQFFMPRGCGATGQMEEKDRDYREIDGTDKIAGYLAETLMMTIHCPHLHILANPQMGC